MNTVIIFIFLTAAFIMYSCCVVSARAEIRLSEMRCKNNDDFY